MKLYDGPGPNPAVVRMFMAERGVGAILAEKLNYASLENRREPYLSKNPTGTAPALELDNGRVIAEITAICEYLDEMTDGPSLIGEDAESRAVTRMWVRRVDLRICEPLVSAFRYGRAIDMFRERMRCLPEAADGLAAIARDGWAWLETQMADGRAFIVGDRLTQADIHLYCFAVLGNGVGQPIPEEHGHVRAWFDRMAARPSASA